MTDEERAAQEEAEAKARAAAEEAGVAAENEAAKKYAALENKAVELGFASVDEYQEHLEELALKGLELEDFGGADNDDDNTTPPKKSSGEDVSESELKKRLAALEKENAESRRQLAITTINSQYPEFALEQSSLPEEKRTAHSKKELTEVIFGNDGELVYRLAQKNPSCGGNIWKAADLFLRLEKVEEKMVNDKTASNKALENAKLSAETGGGNLPASKEKKEKESWQDKIANEIVPDDNYEYPG